MGPVTRLPTTEAGKAIVVANDGTMSTGSATSIAGTVVDNVAALQALKNVTIGKLVYVRSLRRPFISVVPTGVAQPFVLIDSTEVTSPVQWSTCNGLSDASWVEQLSWSIDGLNGNDESSGIDDAHAIRSGLELIRRLNGPTVTWSHSVTIRVLNSVDVIELKYLLLIPGLTVTMVFVPTQTLLQTTVATWTAAAGNFPRKITATGVLDWTTAGPGGTSLVNKRLTVTAGTPANIGAVCMIAKSNPEGLGAATARLSNPKTVDGTQVNLAPGDAFIVESLATCGIFDVEFMGYVNESNVAGQGALQLSGMSCSCTRVRGFGAFNSGVLLFGCDLSDQLSTDVVSLRSLAVIRCSRISVLNYGGFTSDANLYTPFGVNTSVVFYGAYQNHFGHDLFQSVRASYLCTSVSYSGTVYYMDSAAAGLTVSATTVLTNASLLAGAGNATVGLQIRPGGRVYYATAVPPTVTGAAGDISLVSPSGALTVSYVSLPWSDGFQAGHDTLAAGTKDVTVRNWTAGQRIFVTANTPSGVGSPGVLSVPDASRTATKFTVNSSVATDAATFDWTIQPRGDAILIEPYL